LSGFFDTAFFRLDFVIRLFSAFTIFAVMNQTQNIYLAPIQGVFNYHFRKILSRHTRGFDKYFTPFIKTHGLDLYEPRDFREITESANCPVKTIPQIMGSNPALLLSLCQRIQEMGFHEINLNMGCPYPMVTTKKMGSGILPFPEMIDSVLETIFSKMDIAFSVKMRLGMEDSTEIERIIPILNKYPLHEVIIHPRIGKQMYKGEVNLDAFAQCMAQVDAPLVYNGDIVTPEDFRRMQQQFPTINTWMLGRGVAINPFLAEMILSDKTFDRQCFADFHNELVAEYATSYTGGEIQTILKMTEHWAYFIQNFPGMEKKFKAIKKSKRIDQLEGVAREIIFG